MSLLPLEKLSLLDRPLLAFSGGSDSTALFFTLLEHKIPFDIAIVHYTLRDQADEEVKYAQSLAKEHNLQCHLLTAPSIKQNFEYEARKIRYDFFERLIQEKHYTHLLTGHHLQDRLEWMLMQLCKGAGAAELLGMREKEERHNYTLVRPLLELSKEEIMNYLQQNNLKFFHDKSNDDTSYKRNYFRHEVATELILNYHEGIKRSFKYLEEDVNRLIKEVEIRDTDELSLFFSSGDRRSDIYHIDKILKTKGYILTASQREELKYQDEIIAGRKFLVTLKEGIYYIAPYVKQNMDKTFKEECRILGIPEKLRPYLFQSPMAFIMYTKFMPCSLEQKK